MKYPFNENSLQSFYFSFSFLFNAPLFIGQGLALLLSSTLTVNGIQIIQETNYLVFPYLTNYCNIFHCPLMMYSMYQSLSAKKIKGVTPVEYMYIKC